MAVPSAARTGGEAGADPGEASPSPLRAKARTEEVFGVLHPNSQAARSHCMTCAPRGCVCVCAWACVYVQVCVHVYTTGLGFPAYGIPLGTFQSRSAAHQAADRPSTLQPTSALWATTRSREAEQRPQSHATTLPSARSQACPWIKGPWCPVTRQTPCTGERAPHRPAHNPSEKPPSYHGLCLEMPGSGLTSESSAEPRLKNRTVGAGRGGICWGLRPRRPLHPGLRGPGAPEFETGLGGSSVNGRTRKTLEGQILRSLYSRVTRPRLGEGQARARGT